jgi:SAM-dependent methyltransferase
MTIEPHHLSAQRITLNQCSYLANKYPQLKDLNLDIRLDTASAVFQIFVELLKLIDPVAGNLTRTEIFRQLVDLPPDSGLRSGPARALARLYIERGLAGHAPKILSPDDPLQIQVEGLIKQHSEAYGIDLRTFTFKDFKRGFSLIHYFGAHLDMLKGRQIAHIAPEQEFRGWISDMQDTLGCSYTMIDGFMPGMDRYEDLCAMTLDDDSFDTIICHRVLEHVIDGPASYSELFRVLKPGGVLNVSVPEALYLENTSEWVVPDPKFHHHIRIYGRDFPSQLNAAGFRVERADWLIGRPFEELEAVKSYPMLLYNAYKD